MQVAVAPAELQAGCTLLFCPQESPSWQPYNSCQSCKWCKGNFTSCEGQPQPVQQWAGPPIVADCCSTPAHGADRQLPVEMFPAR